MKVKFLEDRQVIDGFGRVEQKFKAGQVVELTSASARHWINRGVAEIYLGDKPKVAPEVAEEAEPEGDARPTKSRGPGRPKRLSA